MADGDTEASMNEARRRGRPPAQERYSSVSTWVPTRYHDRLIDMANQRGMSVSGLVKQIIVLRLRDI